MAESSRDLSESITQRLKSSEVFRHYAASFEAITKSPLSLCSLRQWPPATRGSDCGNPFCDAMLRAGHECIACVEAQQAIAGGDVTGPQAVTCLGALCETGVPVRMGASLIAFLVVGPVLLNAPTEVQFSQTLAVMKRSGIAPQRDELAEAYFKTTLLLPEQHAPILQLLIVFAEHLSILASQLLVQQQHAEPEPILRARKFIEENLAQPLRLKAAATSAGLSTAYFSRMFKKTTALTFTEYLARVRIDQAKQMLLNPNLHVQEVAFAVGFQSVAHFNRVFKKLVGTAPGTYRQQALAHTL